MKKMLRFLVFVLLSTVSLSAFAQLCTAIFPDAVSNSDNGGKITLADSSTIFNSPDNILDTRTLSVPTYNNLSCNGQICTKSDSIVPTGNPLTIPNGSDVTVGFQQTLSLAPGNYGQLQLNSEAVLLLSPGDYTFSKSSSLLSKSAIRLSSDGTVRLWFKDNLTLNSQTQIGTASTFRHFFMYSVKSFNFGSPSTFYGALYAEGDVTLANLAHIYGAATAKNDILLVSASFVTFDASKVASIDFGTFCTGAQTLPVPVAEYRLENPNWTGLGGEVTDSGPNGLHGRAIYYNSGYPTSSNASPAIAGDPGTCRYGIFNGTNTGHLRIEDNSLLDLPSALSVGVWIYPTFVAGSGLRTIVSKDENFEFHLNANREVYWWWGGGSRSLTTTGTALALNTWHHIVITYAVGEQKIYINGVERAATNYNGSMTLNNDPLLIGTDLNYNSRNFIGRIDEVVVYDKTLSAGQVSLLMNQTHPCINVASLGSFEINTGGGTASVCTPKEISIIARDTTGAVIPYYSGNVALTTSTGNGDWSATSNGNPSSDPPFNAVVPGANDSGRASYAFGGSNDGGAVALFLSNQHAEQLTITVADSNSGVSSTSASLTFSENAFDIQTTDTLGADIVAGRDHDYRIDMLRRDPATGSCGQATNYQVANVKAWVTRNTDDPAGSAPQLRTASGVYTLPNAEPATANVTLPFVAGTASFELLTTDVGKYITQFKDASGSFSDQPITGATAQQIVRPFAFDVRATANPAGVSASGPAFVPAGQNFSATARAVLWQALDDTNDDGVADGHADGNPSTGAQLQDNAAAPAFGQESSAEGVQLTSRLIAPAGGADPGLGNGESAGDGRLLTSFTGGSGTSGALYFGEVGAIELNSQIADGNYLAMGSARTQKIRGSAYVGRFYPAAFALQPGSLAEGCTGFTYMEQAFALDYTLTALNARPTPAVTTNYEGSFAKLGASLGSFAYGARSASDDLSARLAAWQTSVSWSAGVGAVQVDPATFTRQAGGAPDGPFTDLDFGLQVQDADGVALASAALDLDVDNDGSFEHGLLGRSIQRYGRLRAKDAFGPESAAIPMFWQTEVYDGAQFTVSANDNCTAIALSQIDFIGATTSLDVAAQTIDVTRAGVTSRFDFSDPLGSQVCFSALAVGFCQGRAGVAYGATGVTVSYPIEVSLANYPHLRFDWDADGDYSDVALPRFTVNFETYRGHDRVIFWRERL
ncbi:LamG domain-containing protein [Simiduia sp. 21SJ11W-1]|uniref:LamG domain-containing protein n=1 Tax=Simiduia sp. 21SJ11W-1 TaxID=2909669 RepID=UPI00209D14DA|nr:LamG domain-containing protein [Simiduia sp. 21SJ11W-1]UTA46576.1 LamG domain-containing protein [Simiduia sp. 21SJ11W-1]